MRSIFLSAFFAFMLPFAASAASWPADTSGTDIGSALLATDPTFEASGIAWHPGEELYVAVSDEGQVATFASDGSGVTEWNLGSGYDLEDVAVVSETSSVVYLLDENSSAALAFDLSTGTLTGDFWSFGSMLSEVGGTQGTEGLAWVPDGAHTHGTTASGGLFYVGWQYDGDVYAFEPDLSTSGSVAYLEELHLTSGYTDVSGLAYNEETSTLYAIYDGLDVVQEWTANGTFVAEYDLAGTNQEGVDVLPTSSTSALFVIAEDGGGVIAYENYPVTVTPIDADADGADADADCDDTDAGVSTLAVYYVDADADTLGSDTSADLCAASAPSGYSGNSDDTNDAIPNFGVEISGDGADNDGDGSVDEVNTVAENGYHPYYSALAATTAGAYGTTILSATGSASGGTVLITYSDNSVYQYQVFPSTATRPTVVDSPRTTAELRAMDGRAVVIVNGYTGSVLAVRRIRR